MPTTKGKNLLYRLALPLLAPKCGKNPLHLISGHPLHYRDSFLRIIQKHHVQGSSTILSCGNNQVLMLTHSSLPGHYAESDTWYRVASITKMATALTCMYLYSQGILDLDSPVAEILDGGKDCSDLSGITLRHLLSHTSGICDPSDLEQSLLSGKSYETVLKKARFDSPGKQFRYSNLGFGLIGSILESVTGLSVDRVFRKFCFSPLCLDATLNAMELQDTCIMPVTRILPFRHQDLRFTELGKKQLTAPDPAFHFGYTAGSMYITIQSLFRLISFFRDGDPGFLNDSIRQEMIKEHAVYGDLSPTLSYGLGMLLISDPALSEGRIIGHQGFAYGCADGAFYEEATGNIMITLNGGCSEARVGRLGVMNRDMLHYAFRKELPSWSL